MDAEFSDVVKSEKEKAVARFNRFCRMRQVLELFVVLGFFSWSSARAPAVLKTAVGCFVEVSAYLFNHHVVFLIGNFIIVLLFVLCRRTELAAGMTSPTDFYDDYVKHSEAVRDSAPPPPPPCPIVESGAGDVEEEKQIVVCKEVEKQDRQCDDVSEAIEKATRQIRKFQRTQSEKLRREITKAKLRRSETQSRQKAAVSSNLERLSSDEFRRRIDDFIAANWCKKMEEKGNRQLLKMY